MTKKSISIRINEKTIEDLKWLAESDSRSQASMIEVLIKEKVAKLRGK